MKRYDELVNRFMQTEFVTLQPSDRLDFADDVMKLGQIRHMPVVEGDRVVGVVSQRDLLAASLSLVCSVLAFSLHQVSGCCVCCVSVDFSRDW